MSCLRRRKKAPARCLVSIDDGGVATAFLAHDAVRLITGETLYVVTKIALEYFGVDISYLIMVGAAWSAGGDSATWWWLSAYFIVITIGELYLSPIGLSLVSKITPARMISTMMGLWLGTSFIGNFVAGWLGSFWSSMDKMSFFIMIATFAASAGVVIWSFNRPLKGILQG
jgi:proton-dependent oligopeptide transporter, POT family